MALVDAPTGADASAIIAPQQQPLTVAEHMPVADAVAEFVAGQEAIKTVVIEQDDFVDGTCRAIASQTHLVAMGPGGVGKTFTGDRAAEVYDMTSLYTVFRNDSKREEVFGPLSMQGLAADRYEHVMGQGYLQDIELFLADEFVDAGRFTRQLLNALNERRFVNGSAVHRIPLKTTIAMTNFTPTDPALDALMDRLPQRFWLTSDLTSDGFTRILRDGVNRRQAAANGNAQSVSLPRVSRAALGTVMWAVEMCAVPDHLFTVLDDVRREATREGLVDRSPRRWQYAVALAQADAVLNGSDVVNETNLRVLRFVLPNAEDEQDASARLCDAFKDPIQQFVDSTTAVVRETDELLQPERERIQRGDVGPDFQRLTDALTKVDSLTVSVEKEQKSAAKQGRPTKALDQLHDVLNERRDFIRVATGLNL